MPTSSSRTLGRGRIADNLVTCVDISEVAVNPRTPHLAQTIVDNDNDADTENVSQHRCAFPSFLLPAGDESAQASRGHACAEFVRQLFAPQRQLPLRWRSIDLNKWFRVTNEDDIS